MDHFSVLVVASGSWSLGVVDSGGGCLTFCEFWICLDEQGIDAADLLKRASEKIKSRLYGGAVEDLNAAIEADPALSDAYFRRASALRHLCRLFFCFDVFVIIYNLVSFSVLMIRRFTEKKECFFFWFDLTI